MSLRLDKAPPKDFGPCWILETKNGSIIPLALKMMKSAVKSAESAAGRVNVSVPAFQRRLQILELLAQHVEDAGASVNLADPITMQVPHIWCSTLRTALAIEMDGVVRIKESKQKLKLPTSEEERRMQQLDVLLSALDVAGFADPMAATEKRVEQADKDKAR